MGACVAIGVAVLSVTVWLAFAKLSTWESSFLGDDQVSARLEQPLPAPSPLPVPSRPPFPLPMPVPEPVRDPLPNVLRRRRQWEKRHPFLSKLAASAPWAIASVALPALIGFALAMEQVGAWFPVACVAVAVFAIGGDWWWTSPYMRTSDLELAAMQAIGARHTLREGLSRRALWVMNRRRANRRVPDRSPQGGPYR